MGDSPHEGPVVRSFAVFFVVSMDKLSYIESSCWLFAYDIIIIQSPYCDKVHVLH